jgi:hypothetical protein
MNNFKEFHYTQIIGNQIIRLDFWGDPNYNLILYKPLNSNNEKEYEISPNFNRPQIFKQFYTTFPKGIRGTKKECLEQIKDYTI